MIRDFLRTNELNKIISRTIRHLSQIKYSVLLWTKATWSMQYKQPRYTVSTESKIKPNWVTKVGSFAFPCWSAVLWQNKPEPEKQISFKILEFGSRWTDFRIKRWHLMAHFLGNRHASIWNNTSTILSFNQINNIAIYMSFQFHVYLLEDGHFLHAYICSLKVKHWRYAWTEKWKKRNLNNKRFIDDTCTSSLMDWSAGLFASSDILPHFYWRNGGLIDSQLILRQLDNFQRLAPRRRKLSLHHMPTNFSETLSFVTPCRPSVSYPGIFPRCKFIRRRFVSIL